MTLRVSYDGGPTYGPVREVQVEPRNAVILGSPTKQPAVRVPSVHRPQFVACQCSPSRGGGAEGDVIRGLGHWVLRHFGRYAGPLCLAAILGGCALVLAGTLVAR